MRALLETVILLFYFSFWNTWDAFITAMLSDRSSAEDVCRVGGRRKKKKNNPLVRKPLQHIRLLSSHIHARSGALMLPPSASDPTSCGRPQTATIYFFGGGRGGGRLSAFVSCLSHKHGALASPCSQSLSSRRLAHWAATKCLHFCLQRSGSMRCWWGVGGGLPIRQLSLNR